METHKNGPFVIAMVTVLALLIGGLAGVGYWMTKEIGRFDPQALLLRLAGDESSSYLAVEEVTLQATDTTQEAFQSTQFALTAQTEAIGVQVNPTSEPQPTPIPTLITPIPTEEIEVDKNDTAATTDESEELSQSETTEGDMTSTETTSEEAVETEIVSSETASPQTAESPETLNQTSTDELPATGLMDELGIPLLIGMAATLVVLIALFRRLQSSI